MEVIESLQGVFLTYNNTIWLAKYNILTSDFSVSYGEISFHNIHKHNLKNKV